MLSITHGAVRVDYVRATALEIQAIRFLSLRIGAIHEGFEPEPLKAAIEAGDEALAALSARLERGRQLEAERAGYALQFVRGLFVDGEPVDVASEEARRLLMVEPGLFAAVVHAIGPSPTEEELGESEGPRET